MKKVLLLSSVAGGKKQQLVDYLNSKLKDQLEATFGLFSDINIEVNGAQVIVKLDSRKITDFDLVVFRGVTDFSTLAHTLAICLKHLKIDFIDSIFGNVSYGGSKFTSLVKLSLAGLPAIPTFFCWRSEIDKQKDFIVKKFGFPLIIKELTRQRGEGVMLVNKIEDFDCLKKWPIEHQFMFQKFYPNDGDFRLLVLGDDVPVFEKKVRTDKKEFRNNVALGSKEVFLDIKTLPDDMKQIAISAAKVMGYQIAGVDILVDHQGCKWILEANRGPALTYDPIFSPELDAFTHFIAARLKVKKNG